MLRSYFKIAFRNLRRQPGYSLINVGGLALGLACAFMIVLFVQHELSFDRFHGNADRIYRFVTHSLTGENAGTKWAISPAAHAPLLQERYPEIEAFVRYDNRSPYLQVEGESRQVEVAFMDSAALSVFDFELVRGNPATALENPTSILLTESAATLLFGQTDPIGQRVTYDDDFDLTVAGVLEDVPATSHLQFEALVPLELMRRLMSENELEGFENYNYYTYLLLAPGVDPGALEEKLFDYRLELAVGDEAAANSYRFDLQPLTDIHLTTDLRWDVSSNVNPNYLLLFGGVALLILLIAGVNFMNLATARAAQRAKEVGLRKVVGAKRGQLVVQFLGESVLMSLVAILLALGLTLLFLPVFRDIIGSAVEFSSAGGGTIALLVGIGLAAGVLAGVYPAFYLSAFRPALVLKGEATKGRGAVLLRRGLIVAQFGISVFLIISTLTVYDQLRFVQSKNLGFDKEQVVWAPIAAPIKDSYDAFRQTLQQDPRVQHVSLAGNLPGRVNTSRGYKWPGQAEGDEEGQSYYTLLADPDLIETLGLKLAAGRNFSRDRPTDVEDAYILNETAARDLGYASPEEAVGQPFRAWDRETGQIIGVVGDFHFQSLHQEIGPVVLNQKPAWSWLVAFRLAPGDVSETLAFLTAQWGRFAPGAPFDYKFLDEDFDRLYKNEAELGRLFGFFAGLAIFIACLGLFGLAAYSAERRTKEIGVRKVVGASVRDVVLLLSKEFTLLVLVGFVAAAPVAYFVMQGWLGDFAYRVGVSGWTFLIAGLAALTIAWLTVSYQSIRAARANPVEALRYE